MAEVGVEVVFTSAPRRNYKAIRQPKVEMANPLGQIIKMQDEVAADFAPDGEFRTSDPDMVEWLRGHVDHGIMFVEVGREPGRLLPTEEDFSAAVVKASIALDTDRLRELRDEEFETHGREGLLRLVDEAIADVEAVRNDPVSGDVTDPNLAEGPDGGES